MSVKIAYLLAGASALGGCSFLYNPNNLPGAKADAAPDAPTVVDPRALGLEAVGPKVLFEGQGTGGSRPAILAITGHDIAQDATVALVPAGAQGAAPMIQIDNEHAVRSLSGTVIAVPVTLPIDMNRGASGTCDGPDSVALTVQVTQMVAGAPVMQALPGQVSLCNLPELDKPITDSAGLLPRYSSVSLPAGLTFTSGTQPVIIRAVGAIVLGDVKADASGSQAGPGGAAGGAKTVKGDGPGGGKPGNAILGGSGLLISGSGGGFGLAGSDGQGTPSNPGGVVTGDEWLVSYAANRSSGGGGGGANPGGGGGGTIELTAGGTLTTTGTISANGAQGGDGGTLSGAGGGGSGGAIVLRSGAVASISGAVTASGGAGGNIGGTKSGGDGGGGRVRYDVPSFSGTAPTMTAGTTRRGVAFSESLEDVPLITHDPQQLLKVVSNKASDAFKIYVRDAVGTTTATATVLFDTTSVAITPVLRLGYNRVCVTPPPGDPDLVESTNCVDIAYVR